MKNGEELSEEKLGADAFKGWLPKHRAYIVYIVMKIQFKMNLLKSLPLVNHVGSHLLSQHLDKRIKSSNYPCVMKRVQDILGSSDPAIKKKKNKVAIRGHRLTVCSPVIITVNSTIIIYSSFGIKYLVYEMKRVMNTLPFQILVYGPEEKLPEGHCSVE